jgi:hypothetical protein
MYTASFFWMILGQGEATGVSPRALHQYHASAGMPSMRVALAWARRLEYATGWRQRDDARRPQAM